MDFRTTVELGGKTATGLRVPDDVVEAVGLQAGEDVAVRIELDDAPREVPVPDDLASAMDDAARTAFEGLAYSHRKEWVRWVEEAKKPETRTARIEKTVVSLREGK